MTKRPRHILCVASPTLCLMMLACSSGSDQTAKSYIQTVTNACTQSGGSISSNGAKNCDYQAVVTSSAGATIESTDTASQTAIDAQNANVSNQCEAAAQLASVQCKFDKLSSDTATCQKLATNLVQTVSAASRSSERTGTSSGSSGTSSAALFSALMGTAQSSSNGADCSEAFKNAYMTYMTALNGSLANSQEGCAILEANLGKVLKSYQGMVDGAGLAALMQMGDSLKGSGSCPANTVMKMVYSQLGSSGTQASQGTNSNPGSSTTASSPQTPTRTTSSTGPSVPQATPSPSLPPSLRLFKETRFHDFPVVY